MRKLILFTLVAMLCSSCAVTYKTRTARMATVPTTFWTIPSLADLEVKEEKVSGSSEGDVNRRKFFLGKKVQEDNAIAKALQSCGADVLIEPQFVYEYKKARLQKVTVTGYPGYFRNFRAVPYEDIKPKDCDKETAPQVVIYSAGEQK